MWQQHRNSLTNNDGKNNDSIVQVIHVLVLWTWEKQVFDLQMHAKDTSLVVINFHFFSTETIHGFFRLRRMKMKGSADKSECLPRWADTCYQICDYLLLVVFGNWFSPPRTNLRYPRNPPHRRAISMYIYQMEHRTRVVWAYLWNTPLLATSPGQTQGCSVSKE